MPATLPASPTLSDTNQLRPRRLSVRSRSQHLPACWRSPTATALAQHESNLWLPTPLPNVDEEVAVHKYGPETRATIESVLVPIAGGPHSSTAVDVGVGVADHWDASVHLLTIVPPSSDGSAHQRAEVRLQNYADEITQIPVKTTVRRRDDVVMAIAEFTRSHELVVMGASEYGWVKRLFAETLPARLDEHAEAPILVVSTGPE